MARPIRRSICGHRTSGHRGPWHRWPRGRPRVHHRRPAPGPHEGAHPHHLRPRRVRLRGSAGRGGPSGFLNGVKERGGARRVAARTPSLELEHDAGATVERWAAGEVSAGSMSTQRSQSRSRSAPVAAGHGPPAAARNADLGLEQRGPLGERAHAASGSRLGAAGTWARSPSRRRMLRIPTGRLVAVGGRAGPRSGLPSLLRLEPGAGVAALERAGELVEAGPMCLRACSPTIRPPWQAHHGFPGSATKRCRLGRSSD